MSQVGVGRGVLLQYVLHDEDDMLDELGVGLVHYHLEQIHNSSVKTGKQVVWAKLFKKGTVSKDISIVVVLIL